jgi:rhamnosyltransferase
MISIIIPTYNRADQLEPLLQALDTQSVRGEVFVVDSSPDGRCAALALGYGATTETIDSRDFDHGGTRANAAKKASGDIIIFLTQDALPVDKKAIENILKCFEDEKIGAAYGKQLAYPDATLFGAHLREFNYQNDSYKRTLADSARFGIKTAFLSNSFAAYRKSALEDIGWFKDSLLLGEDTYAGGKMLLQGYALAYCADASVYHSHNYSPWQEFKRYFDIGAFHAHEGWLIKTFGQAEGEGVRFVVSELGFLSKKKQYHLFFVWFARNFLKFAGYKLGMNYKFLPKALIMKLSMHPNWWRKYV